MTDDERYNHEMFLYKKNVENAEGEHVRLVRDLYNRIKDLHVSTIEWPFIMAQCYNILGDVDNARTMISGLIDKVESVGYAGVVSHENLGKFYFLAGEILAKLNNYQLSLDYYNKSNYHLAFLKSMFESDSLPVYSFRKFNEYSLSDLINDSLTVNPSDSMNDPFDSIINLWSDESRLLKTCNEKKHIKPYHDSFRNFRIRSFVQEENDSPFKNTLMWAHYADEHRGFCVKYNLSEDFIKQKENDSFEHMYMRPVKYSDEKIDLEAKSMNSTLAFATKQSVWEYEHEVRLIVFNPNKSEAHYGIKLDDASRVEAIYFGCRCSKQVIETIMRIFSLKTRPCPKFYKMEINDKDVYNMTSTEIFNMD